MVCQLSGHFLLELVDQNLILLHGKVGLCYLLCKCGGGLVLLDLKRIVLALQCFQLLLQCYEVLLILVEHFLAYLPEKVAFLGRDRCIDFHLTDFSLE